MSRYVLFAIIAAVLSLAAWQIGVLGARAYERMLVARVTNGLDVLGFDWAEIRADGLQLELHGHAPDEFARELALESAGATAPMATITDFATATLAPPERRAPVRVELLRDQRGVTMTGQTSNREMRSTLNAALGRDGPGLEVYDLTGIQAASPGRGWGPEIQLASLAAAKLPNAYVVMEPGRVVIEGQAKDIAARTALSNRLKQLAGPNIALTLKIRIPAEIIAPFGFSAERGVDGRLRVERCAARDETEYTAFRAVLATAEGRDRCKIGLGGPGGDWNAAVVAGLQALSALPAGRIDLEYRDVRLTGHPPTAPEDFAAARDALREAVPEGFKADGILLNDDVATRTTIARERYWMHMHLGGPGLTISGQMPGKEALTTLGTYAKALFGRDRVELSLTASDAPSPQNWQIAAMALLDQLALSHGGEAHMAGYGISLNARVSQTGLVRQIHDELRDGLPDYRIATQFEIDLPRAIRAIPLPGARCADQLNRINHARPIDFDTGSAVIAKDSRAVLDDLAALFQRCTGDRIEIGGHTDAQGSEDLNERISQARAEAVVSGLVRRGVPTRQLTARGYGESVPIADNKTPEGRARNRRIEFLPAQ